MNRLVDMHRTDEFVSSVDKELQLQFELVGFFSNVSETLNRLSTGNRGKFSVAIETPVRIKFMYGGDTRIDEDNKRSDNEKNNGDLMR